MPAQTSDTAAVCTPVAGRERHTSASMAAAAESAPSTPPASSAVSRLALFRGIAPDDAAEAPAAAAARSDGALPREQSLAPPTPPASPPASPVNAEPVDSAEADDGDVDGETVVVFDWDDTLMATTVLTRQVCRAAAEPTRPVLIPAHVLRLRCSTVSTSTQRNASRAGWSRS